MLNKPSNTGISRVLALAVTLLGLLAVLVLATTVASAQETPDMPMEVEYAENGEGPVRTFTSTDPEGGGIDWDVTGTDADDFSIDSRGMLTFNSPPNFEGATDRAHALDLNDDGDTDDDGETDAAGNNMYQITVRATEQETAGDDVRALSTETRVTVEVTDVNESGTVTLNRLEPEVGTQIMASLSDPDRDVSMTGTFDHDGDTDTAEISRGWTWYVSKVTDPVADADNHWVVATGGTPTTAVYTPAGKRVEGENVTPDDPNVAVDEGKYLRAVVRYTDVHGAEKTAIGVSMNPVRPEVSSDLDGAENPENGSPGFSSAGDYSRSVLESIGSGMSVGAPVVAIDPNDDTLTYELDSDRFLADADDNVAATPEDDVHYFSIDRATGEIKVAKTLDYDDNADGYKFHVRAIDPSGETAEVEVAVNVIDANDAPEIMDSVVSGDNNFEGRSDPPSELRVMEKADDTYDGSPDMLTRSVPGGMNVFTADDEDARGQIFWDIMGEDVDDFELTSSSPDPNTGLRGPGEPIALKFKNDPDFENPTDSNRDSVYKVTIVARDRFTGGLTDERPLTIFVDNVPEDGKAELSEEQPHIGENVIASVVDPDNGVAIVTWRWERSAAVGANAEWTVINGATTGTYKPVKADDGQYLQATATYTDITSNEDAPGTLLVDERTQKGVDTAPVARNPEEEEDADKLYRVMVESKNAVRVAPGGATEVEAPQFSAPSYDRTVAENAETGSIVGDAVQAVEELDDDGEITTTFKYGLEDTISGDDSFFTINFDTGQIRVGEVSFPAPLPAGVIDLPENVDAPGMTDPTLDYEGNNTFTLIVSATDTDNGTRKAIATVNISLTNLNERPYFDKVSRDAVGVTVTYSEHRTNAVVPQLAAVEPDGGSLRWEVTGADAGAFVIVDVEDIGDGKDRVQLRFKSQPNFEARGGVNSPYNVIVRATEVTAVGGGPALAATLDVTVQVDDSNEDGSVELNWLQPEVGTPIMASLSDPDVGVTDPPSWTWYRAKAIEPNRNPDPDDTDKLEGEWELITTGTGFDAATYTPVGADEDKYLLARVTYNDTPGGAGDENQQAAVRISAYKVREDVLPADNNSPDFNQSETTREIPEGTAVGDPVGDPVDVDRNEDNDVLTYEIFLNTAGGTATTVDIGGTSYSTDLAFFSIDKRTGQIMVKKNLSAEETDGRNYTGGGDNQATAGVYTVVVRATDSSSEEDGEDQDDIVVKITAKNVDEAPGVTDGMAELSVNEVNSTAKDDDVTKYVGLGYVLAGPDGNQTMELADGNPNLYHRTEEDILDRAFWPEPLAGPDGQLFEYSTPDNGIGRRIHFINPPNYEDPQDANRDNVYEVTIRVVDGDGLVGEKSVRVTVMNVDEKGKLTLSPEQPDDGMPVIATITDPDSPVEYGGVVVTNWEWAASETTVASFIEAMLDPTASMSEYTGSVGEFLWARVSYRDGASDVDDPVTALDDRNYDEAGTLIPDAGDTDEMESAGTANAVQPDPDPPTGGTMPDTGVQEMEISVYENVPSTGYVGMPIEGLVVKNAADRVLADRDTIGGPDADTFVFAEDNDHSGDDSDYSYYFHEVDDADEDGDKAGQLALAPVTHLDAEGSKTTYVIEISDPEADIEVSVFRITITVMDVNEAPSAPSELRGLPPALNVAPEFAAATDTREVAENTAAGENIGAAITATDADDDTLTYTLGGADAASFAIDSATGQIMTMAALDFETQASYTVEVTADDGNGGTATVTVTITVTDVDEDTPLVRYDTDNSGDISRDEVIEAINDYLIPDPNNPTTRDVVIAVINLYLLG